MSNAIDLGFQSKVELRLFTLRQLSAMETCVNVPQAPLNTNLDTLAKDLKDNCQVEPFSVASVGDTLYLVGGRNRLHTQINFLHRDLDTQWACLFYALEERKQVNALTIAKNATRTTRAPEKKLLLADSAANAVVGQDDLSEFYNDSILSASLKELREVFLAETMAKLLNVLPSSISGTLTLQLLTSCWQVIKIGKYKHLLSGFFLDAENIYAMQDVWLAAMPKAVAECQSQRPHISNWGREGKCYLIDACNAEIKAQLATFSYPKLVKTPIMVTVSTETKKKPAKKVMAGAVGN